MCIDTIIFDCEGVIVDTEDIWDRGTEEFLRRRDLRYDRDKIKHLLTGRSLADGVHVMQHEYGFDGDPETLARERMEIVKDLFEQKVAFIEGFEEFFGRVRGACKTCIATSLTEPLLRIVSERLGLSRMFDSRIFTPERTGCRPKPHPDLFLFAARRLRSEISTCVVIEDAPHGVEAAKRAGMRCIALTSTYTREKLRGADVIVDSYRSIDLRRPQAI